MQELKNRNPIKTKLELPVIPEKLYFSIGEVSKLCDIKAYVLRYWEQEFQQLTPIKRRGNRRSYQRKDILLIREIKTLLYDQGFTIDGARNKLEMAPPPVPAINLDNKVLQKAIKELESVIEFLEN